MITASEARELLERKKAEINKNIMINDINNTVEVIDSIANSLLSQAIENSLCSGIRFTMLSGPGMLRAMRRAVPRFRNSLLEKGYSLQIHNEFVNSALKVDFTIRFDDGDVIYNAKAPYVIEMHNETDKEK